MKKIFKENILSLPTMNDRKVELAERLMRENKFSVPQVYMLKVCKGEVHFGAIEGAKQRCCKNIKLINSTN